ncbi:MAG: hypothetical protein V4642_00720 [Bacteroidota bacterium]
MGVIASVAWQSQILRTRQPVFAIAASEALLAMTDAGNHFLKRITF